MADRGQGTEQPTERRKDKARKDGKFPVSRELVTSLQFFAFAALVTGGGGVWFAGMLRSFRFLLGRAFGGELTAPEVSRLAGRIVFGDLAPIGVLSGALLAVTLAAQLAVTQFGLSAKNLTPQFSRMSPLGRLRELPRQNLPLFFQAVVMLPVFGAAVWGVVKDNLDTLAAMPLESVQTGALAVGASIESLIWKATAVFLALGVFDYWRQRRRYTADLRMTKQEIRDEMKELEGNPQVKMRIRRLQRDLLRRRMMHQVPTATAVIVNPTHYAIAIRYTMEAMAAPVVVAKGKNYLAQRIRQVAVMHQVPIVENPPLAQALYKSAEVGQEIPAHLYRAVAEILAYIYRLMGGRLPA
jgi:flagellar biosynthesis protein FlhB